MIAADSSVWIDFFKGVAKPHCEKLESNLASGAVVIPMPVLFEILSSTELKPETEALIKQLPCLEPFTGYWVRAGELRRKLLRKGLKARSIDCLIAQNCIDHEVAIISGDQDFRHFMQFGLRVT